MRRTLSDIGLALALATGAGCPGDPMTGPADLRGGAADQAAGDASAAGDLRPPADLGADLARPPDLTVVDLVPPPDLFRPDLAPPTIDPQPACANANVTAAMVYPVMQANCSGGGCHIGGMGGMLSLGADAAAMRAALVNVDSRSPGYRRVVPSNVDGSLLLYKLLGQQGKLPNGGGSMPPGAMLGNTDLCLIYNWVRSGAN